MQVTVFQCTVLLPVYNVALYIRETLDSVLRQTAPATTIIICDNASTDDTLAILESYA